MLLTQRVGYYRWGLTVLDKITYIEYPNGLYTRLLGPNYNMERQAAGITCV